MIGFHLLAIALALSSAPASVHALNNGVAKVPGLFLPCSSLWLTRRLVLGYNSQFSGPSYALTCLLSSSLECLPGSLCTVHTKSDVG